MFFITLSCAQNYWPDISALVKKRMKLAGDQNEDCFVGSPKLSAILNDYFLVVQEYFQHRVMAWLDTVGKEVLGIKHHYAKYEFAPGRGQIHVHMLAICEDNSIYKLCHHDINGANSQAKRAERMTDFAKKKFGLTANVPDNFESVCIDTHPSSISFSNADKDFDDAALLKACQIHKCNGYCMQKATHSKE